MSKLSGIIGHQRAKQQQGIAPGEHEHIRYLSYDDLIRLLLAMVDELGSSKALSEQIGCSSPHISNVINRRSDPGPTVLGRLGLEKVIAYRWIQKPSDVA